MATTSKGKYDRQIRLWGQHGQEKCLRSTVCVIQANSLGTEVLKGLTLAGLGSYDILDSHKLVIEDFGSLLLPHDCLGKSRAVAVRSMLADMSEDTYGVIRTLETIIPHTLDGFQVNDDHLFEDTGRHIWKGYKCIIVCGFLYGDQIMRLTRLCWQLKIPLINCRSIGYIGSIDCQIRDHVTIETHPDNPFPDLFLDRPFDKLRDYFESIDFENAQTLDKIHRYPYIVIIYKYLKKWQKNNGLSSRSMPKSRTEITAIRNLIDEGRKHFYKLRKETTDSLESTSEDSSLENFHEAGRALRACLAQSSQLPESVKALFEHSMANQPFDQETSLHFWQIIKALREFVTINDGLLPFSGSLPDMISSSEEYIKLQKIFTVKAREDLDSLFKILRTKFDGYHYLSEPLYKEIEVVCKNIRDIQVLTTGKISYDFDVKQGELSEDEQDDEYVTIGLCLKALDLFYTTYSRLPGGQEDQVEADITKMRDCLKQIMGKSLNRLKTIDQWVYEVCRYGGTQIHATSAFLGGCVAQEVIKIITNQFIPAQSSLVYNAKTSIIKPVSYKDFFKISG